MNRTIRKLGILGIAAVIAGSLPLAHRPSTVVHGAAADTLDAAIRRITDAPLYRHARWGVAVADAATGALLYERDADRLFATASTMKLFSAAAALVEFGAAHRFETPLHRRGEVRAGGRLEGELILRAVGDPNLTGRIDRGGRLAFTSVDHTNAEALDTAELTATDPLSGLDDLAAQVARAGIRRVRDVLVDDRLFDATTAGSIVVSPVMVNDNVIDVTVTPAARAGTPARVTTRPATAHAEIETEVTTVEAEQATRVQVARVGARRYAVRGQIARGRKPLVKIAPIDDPAAFARTLLIERLETRGVQVERDAAATDGAAALPEGYDALPIVARHTSAPFSETVKVILKTSNNPQAGILSLLLASRRGERSVDAGLLEIGALLGRLGLDLDALSIGSAAGSARSDQVTPRSAIELLRAMAARADARAYRDALPILGVDGTLADAVGPRSPARGRVFAKSGTGVTTDYTGKVFVIAKGLAGYMTAASGRRLVFAIYVNSVEVGSLEEALGQGRVLARVAEAIQRAH